MKTPLKIYLEPEDLARLTKKAEEQGMTGRGAITRYIEKVSREPVCFLDRNVKALLEVLKVSVKA